jgi:very-short-patch-repair endonuclease
LVTGENVFSANGHIAALKRYIEYYAPDEEIALAPVVSAFDLLYREYDQSLAALQARLRPGDSRYKSEQIVAQLLREAMSDPSCQALMWHAQVRLNQVALSANLTLDETGQRFLRRSTCDFVVYYKVGKTPLGVIEVDGGFHDRSEQRSRDQIKDSILKKSGLHCLRLPTVQSDIENKIKAFLRLCMSRPPADATAPD